MFTTHYYVCPNCGEVNDADRKCCTSCYEDLAGEYDIATCGDCGEELEWTDDGWYCENCDNYPDEVYHKMS